ncbi:MAG: hypothetical protein LBD85_06965 [Oscillospiraceae bacterium]|nr:hypothetical protein [Oscillospiraceae bacterium]
MAQLNNNTLEALSRFQMDASAGLTPNTKPADAAPPSVSGQPTAVLPQMPGSGADYARASALPGQDVPKTLSTDFNRVGNPICQRAFATKMFTPKQQPAATSQQTLQSYTAFQRRDCSAAPRNSDGSV